VVGTALTTGTGAGFRFIALYTTRARRSAARTKRKRQFGARTPSSTSHQ